MQKQITLEDLKSNDQITTYIKKANEYLGIVGYTDHGMRHCNLVANIARNILKRLGCSAREQELAAMSGYLHDIGNIAGRHRHEQIGALISMDILERMGMSHEELADISLAIGNHEETSGIPVSNISAALILADKTDVHETRVRKKDKLIKDAHDTVNYAVKKSFLRVDEKAKTINLELTVDTNITNVMSYFEIFLDRMLMCQKAARYLGCKFGLVINRNKLV